MTGTIRRFDLSGQAFKRDPFPTFAAMRAAGPLVTMRAPIVGEMTFATTHAAVDELLKSPDRFSVDLARAGKSSRVAAILRWGPRNLRLLARNMLQQDDPEHRRLRKLVDGAFRRADIDAMRPRIERLADRLLDDLEASSDRDLVRHVARDLPLAVISEMLGLPQKDRPRFTRWMASMSTVSSIWGLFRLFPALSRINRYLRGKFEERRAAPADDLISALAGAEAEGDRLSEDELLAMCFLLFVAGHETTTHLISGGVLALLQNPAELRRLRADPALTPRAVDELLRHVSPVQMSKPRFPVADATLAGAPARRGQPIMAVLASANADPEAFEHPERLDIGRERNRHHAFGGGPHFCLGAWLARAEMEILLTRLLARAPNLALAVPEAELRWTSRLGIRALTALPLRL